MSYVLAFLVGGCICLIAQLFFKMKPNPIVILAVSISLGGLLALLGIMGKLAGIGGAGLGVMILSCGEAIFGSFLGLLAGDSSGFIMLAGLILFACIVLGLGGGVLQHKMDKKRQLSEGVKG